MLSTNKNFRIVSGSAHPDLVKKIAGHLGVEPLFIDTGNWGNGYPRTKKPDEESVASKKVIIVSSMLYRGIGSPFEELGLMVDACASATEIHLVIPWLCGKDDVAHSAGHIPNLPWLAGKIVSLNPRSINLFDLHNSIHEGLFHPLKTRRFYLLPTLLKIAKEIGIDQIACADDGSLKRANKVKDKLGITNSLFITSKAHDEKQSAGQQNVPLKHSKTFGSLLGEKVGIFDDMILSFSTMLETLKNLKEDFKAPEIHVFAPHFDPTPDVTLRNIQEAFKKDWLTKLHITNTTPIDPIFLEVRNSSGEPGINVVDISGEIANIIKDIIDEKSTAPKFDDM